MNRQTVFGVAVSAALCIAVLVFGGRQVSAKRQGPTRQETAMALREGGLHAAAKAAGGFYNLVMPGSPDIVVPDLTTLARVSDDVVIGEILSNESHLGPEGRYITTDYKVRVDEVLMGSLRNRDEIVLSVLGGRVEFGDGTAAQVSTTQFDKPTDGEKLALFLTAVKPENMSSGLRAFAGDLRVFGPTRGGLGLFGLPEQETRTVKSKGRSTDPVSRESRKKPKSIFLRDLKSAVKEAQRIGLEPGGVDLKTTLR